MAGVTQGFDVDSLINPGKWAAEVAVDAEELLLRIYQTTAADLADGDEDVSDSVLDSEYVRAAVAAKVRDIMASTEARARQVADVILDLEASDADLDEIVDEVRGTFDQRHIWAATTARTETTDAVNSASLFTATALGLLTKEWLSSRDSAVRHAHSRLGGGDGQRAPVASPFLIGGFPMMYPGDPAGPPHLRINCFPDGTVADAIGVQGAYRRWYDGPMVSVVATGGHNLTGTPNHPVLTRRGWVGLGELKPGDHLIGGRFGENVRAADPDVDGPPAAIEEIVDAAVVGGNADWARARSVDFHGDGGESDVQIVAANRLLEHAHVPTLSDPSSEESLTGTNLRSGKKPRGSLTLELELRGRLTAADGLSGEKTQAVLLGGLSGGDAAVRLGAAAQSDTSFSQSVGDQTSADSEVARQLENAGALGVSTHEVIDVKVRSFHGYVSNLQTELGYYIANGLVVRNCRCSLIFDSRETEDEPLPPSGAGDLERLLDEHTRELTVNLVIGDAESEEDLRRYVGAAWPFALFYLGIHPSQLTFLASLVDVFAASPLDGGGGTDWINPLTVLLGAVKKHAALVAVGVLVGAVAAREEAVQAAEQLGLPPPEIQTLTDALAARETAQPNSVATVP